MRYEIDWIGPVSVPTPVTPAPPAPVLIRPTNFRVQPIPGLEAPPPGVTWDTAAPPGGCLFNWTTPEGVKPTLCRAYWLPADFDQQATPETILNSGHPYLDLASEAAGDQAVAPPETVPAGAANLAIVSGYDD